MRRTIESLKIVVLEQKRRPAKEKPVPKKKPLQVGGFAEISLEK